MPNLLQHEGRCDEDIRGGAEVVEKIEGEIKPARSARQAGEGHDNMIWMLVSVCV